MKIIDSPVIVEETFPIERKVLWKIITELDHMHNWFFDSIPAFEPVVGFETSFILSTGQREFDHVWMIVEVIPEVKIVYDWSYTDYQGRGEVSFELVSLGSQTKLILSNLTKEDWQKDIPEFRRESAEGGWDYFIRQNLKKYVAELDLQ